MEAERLIEMNQAAALVAKWEGYAKRVADMEKINPLKDLFSFPETPPASFWAQYHAQLTEWTARHLEEARKRFEAM
jgi:hypothetical protein